MGGACVFCRTPLAESHAPIEVLTFLKSRLPMAKHRRFGLINRGEVSEIDLTVGAKRFRARVRRGALVLEPDLPPARWVDELIRALSAGAATDAGLRARLTRAGWALR